MADSPRQLAEHKSFQAFINCYLREIDSGVWLSGSEFGHCHWLNAAASDNPWLVQLPLAQQNLTLWLSVSYRSQVGCHHIDSVYAQHNIAILGSSPHAENFWSATLLLIKELFHERGNGTNPTLKQRQLELTHRLTDSLQNTVRYLEARWQQPYTLPDNFLASEQSLLLGHWLHPTPKSRQGIHEWQHKIVTPEMQGELQLHYFAAAKELIEQDSLLPQSAAELIAADLHPAPPLHGDEQLLPVHPLQAQWLLSREPVQQLMQQQKLRYLGPLGPKFAATSSVRTLYRREARWMYKVSVPIKITNSLRQNKRHELDAGLLMAELVQATGFCHYASPFQLLFDPAYITLRGTGESETGFETILRDNIFTPERDANVYCLGALLQDTWHPQQESSLLGSIIKTQAKREKRSAHALALDWFDAYWHCAIEPCIVLFDRFGIALEAHQQNSLLRLHNGYPDTYYYRDNQGYYLERRLQSTLQQLQPKLKADSDLFYDTESILDRFGYYLLVNQVFALIYRLGADELVKETQLLALMRTKLRRLQARMQGSGAELLQRWLTEPHIAAKANLLTRVHDIDELEAELELAAYTKIGNPLCEPEPVTERSREAAYV
ncbi:IucA/IucC family siderophore biosynthesis protein [Gilvimarinus sp. DA14]|uniref:IucA/IucC family protein n=1 Tax=Gilvimarinus sp. DA14 TaxID=2956798 RepID=UPI0020B64EE4|nr:IucA/IucC family protein [Gilvimarinus sp. DA14]UTF61540.1 hypothetical protein NHM04_07020 [Gilvimarinus sp. DA14]